MAALSTSNIQNTGIGGGRRLIMGDWTASLGDGSATVAVEGRKLYGAQFLTFDADDGSSVPITSVRVSGGIITITLSTVVAVTAGTFSLIVA